jgi:hypothetical protein
VDILAPAARDWVDACLPVNHHYPSVASTRACARLHQHHRRGALGLGLLLGLRVVFVWYLFMLACLLPVGSWLSVRTGAGWRG